jgi:hypothetical protein
VSAIAVLRGVFFTAAWAGTDERVGEAARVGGDLTPRGSWHGGPDRACQGRNRIASGQALAKATRTRLAVSPATDDACHPLMVATSKMNS